MNSFLEEYTNEFRKRVGSVGKKDIKAQRYLVDRGILSWDNFLFP